MSPEIEVGVSLPGEALACKLIDAALEISRGQTPAQRKQIWDWIIADIDRWRKFWGMDNDPITLSDIFTPKDEEGET